MPAFHVIMISILLRETEGLLQQIICGFQGQARQSYEENEIDGKLVCASIQ